MVHPSGPQPVDLSQTGAEPAEESLEQERDAVGDQRDEGGLVCPDHAQSTPED